ncbi:MAG: DinB family protein [Ktedonobacteraceae bacterium]|nr:DinB family protein [Ktedonobacteraceae bacterium]MBO0789439.1 DinB family protein [Ktedonobacteraceae bacterium]
MLATWFDQQLRSCTDGFLWAVELIPPERLYLPPRQDRWPVARIIYHLLSYERAIALPTMRQWLGGPRPIAGTPQEDAHKEEQSWNNGQEHTVQKLIDDFKAVRAEQFALLPLFSLQQWDEERDVIWGSRPLKWVITKTYQHTLEHIDEVLRAYLWWK